MPWVDCCSWHQLADESPSGDGFYWVWDSREISLGYWTGKQFQVPETVGDREGLSVEWIPGVTHFSNLTPPPPPA